MGGMTGLQHLDLGGCQSLKELPASMGGMTGLQHLGLRFLNLHTPPRDVVAQGTAAVLQYLSDLDQGSGQNFLIKLVLVGDQCAGKSSLIDSFCFNEPRPRAESNRTVGIDICRWRPDAASSVVAQVYDVAGHKVYHASHRVFMSRDALYVNVVRCDIGLDDCLTSLCKWMDLVQTAAPGCVMAVVVSHTDAYGGDITEFLGTLLRNAQNVATNILCPLDEQISNLENRVGKLLENESTNAQAWADLRAKRDSLLREFDDGLVTAYPFNGEKLEEEEEEEEKEESLGSVPWTRAGISMQKQLQQCHSKMEEYETKVFRESDGGGKEGMMVRLAQLRRGRCNRLRVIFCGGVSNTSGAGHAELKQALQRILGSTELFTHLGMKVPLNYLLLERCMRHGNSVPVEKPVPASHADADGKGHRDPVSGEELADWEMGIVSYDQKKAREYGPKLEALKVQCCRRIVKLAKLSEAASKCGIADDELKRAIRFLHTSGSLLYFGREEGAGDAKGGEGKGEGGGGDGWGLERANGQRELDENVFTQPSWIIDAVKCFIAEKDAKDVNDEFRRALKRVKQQYKLDMDKYHATGRLSSTLLRRLWTKLGGTGDFCSHEAVLVPLLCSLRLMIPLDVYAGRAAGSSADQTYVVPAMFPAKDLPANLVEPSVWCPQEAGGADRFMRRQYEGLGYVPHGFLGELQIAWSCGHGAAKHYALQEDPLASSKGSHLIASYDGVEEQVVVSLWQELDMSDGVTEAQSKLCVCAWAKVMEGVGATPEWRLFERVTECIEQKGKESHCALLLTDPMVPLIDDDGAERGWVQLSECQEALSKGEKQLYHEDAGSFRSIPLDQLIPMRSVAGKRAREEDELEPRKRGKAVFAESRAHEEEARVDDSPAARQTGGVESGGKPRILAFFAQARADQLNTKGESQNLSESMLHPHYFEFDPHAQPLFTHFQYALMCCASRSVRIVHLAGHADRKGFYFAKDERGLVTEPIEAQVITDLLVHQRKQVECVVLNACSTEEAGRQLRAGGMKHVVCWRGKVHDEAALEFSKMFYRSLQVGAGPGCTAIPPGAYKNAFMQGCAALRVWRGRQGPDRGNKGKEICETPKAPAMKAQVVLLLSEDGDEVCQCSVPAGEEGGDAAKAASAVSTGTEASSAPAAGGSIEADQDQMALDVDNADAGDTRNATNDKGKWELRAFQALGVRLEYPPGVSIEQTITKYQKGTVSSELLARYGLEEDPRNRDLSSGRQQLRLTVAALRSMFKVHELPGVELNGYADVFGWEGALVQWARRGSGSRRQALTYLQSSLQLREQHRGSMDAGHAHMVTVIRESVQAIESLLQ